MPITLPEQVDELCDLAAGAVAAPIALLVQRVEAELDAGNVEPGVDGIAVDIEVDFGVEDASPGTEGP